MAVTESSQPSAARFLAHELAHAVGFGEEDAHRAGIVATEMATNLVKHAQEGEFIARSTEAGDVGEIELLAVDRGPGIRDVSASMIDGQSTVGSAGNGLGAVRRLSDTFDLFSDPRGTVVMSRLRRSRRAADAAPMIFGGVSIPMTGESVCGDAWQVRQDVAGASVVLVDGLGHGLYASEAAVAALAAFSRRADGDTVSAMQAMHDGIRHTRGAAAAVAVVDRRARAVSYCGVGNISTVIAHDAALRHAVSHNGTLGHQARAMREYSYAWFPDALLIMHSDGLATHWTLDDYRGLRGRHPAVIAAVLYRDHSRRRDDVTVIVGRES